MPYPSKKKPEIITDILERIAKGEPLAVICRTSEEYPTPTSWGVWVRDDEELAIAYGRAREEGFDAIAAEALEIIDAAPERVITMSGDDRTESRIDSASVQWAKNRAELRLKLLAKWSPKKYGDKLELAGDKDAPLTVNIVRFCDDED